jgi:hypothetical protein
MPFDLAEPHLIAAEQTLGATLPASYRQAMLRSNGGEVATADEDWVLHPIADKADRKRLARSASHILKETAALKAWPGFPAAAVAIASNGEGDALVFVRREGGFDPAVYAWSHETGKLTSVANDFSELKAA